jgi:hypothetical protein
MHLALFVVALASRHHPGRDSIHSLMSVPNQQISTYTPPQPQSAYPQQQQQQEKKGMSLWVWGIGLGAAAFFVRPSAWERWRWHCRC